LAWMKSQQRARDAQIIALAREGKTGRQIAEAIGCSRKTVNDVRKTAGIVVKIGRPSGTPSVRKPSKGATAALMVALGATPIEAAEALGVTRQAVQFGCRVAGVTPRHVTDGVATMLERGERVPLIARAFSLSDNYVRTIARDRGIAFAREYRTGTWPGTRTALGVEYVNQGDSITIAARKAGVSRSSVSRAVKREIATRKEIP